MLLIIASFIIFFYYRKNKRTIIKFDNARQQLNDIPVIHKKEYNIDKKLENKFLKGINELKKSTDFLDPGFSIKVLSKKLNTNTSYLSYIINKEFNQSFKQYITELRIEYLIKKLTRESKYKNYTIKSLGEEIGYTNASAFTRAFKKYKGITPSEFIKYLNQS